MSRLIFALLVSISVASALFFSENSFLKDALIKSLNPVPPGPTVGPFPPIGQLPGPIGKGCPLCDSSVYSYCSYKMVHDACCCTGGNVPFHCPPSDCSFLNANTCQEHSLLFICCCNNPYH